MPNIRYRFSMKSEEQEGASQTNSLDVDLTGDTDAHIFATNLETLFAADVVTVDQLIQVNYVRTGTPKAYPAGTDSVWRYVVRASDSAFVAPQTERLFDIGAAVTPEAFAAAYIAVPNIGVVPPAKIATQPARVAPASVQMYVFNLSDSH